MIIDISPMLKHFGKIIPGSDIEIELVKTYSYKSKSRVYRNFTQIVLKKLYGDDVEREFSEIATFYKENVYHNFVMNFLTYLDIMILNKNNPYLKDVIVEEIIEYNKDKLIIRIKPYFGNTKGR